MFANGDVAAMDLCGKILWAVELGVPDNRYGYAASPVLFGSLIVIQFDGAGENGKPSEIMALDSLTGKRVWSTKRPVQESWPTPIIADTGKGKQILTMANDWIIGYEPASGKELWRVKGGGSDVAPSPIFAGGLVIASLANDLIMAVRPDGNGDVTKTHLAWKSEDGVSDVASPVGNTEMVLFAHSGGTLTCLDVKTGKIIWDKSLEAEFYASPTLAGDRVYLVGRGGDVFVTKFGRRYEELGKSSLGEPSDCSPAIVDGRLIARGMTNLFCIVNQ
jgi:outer membrane protein assembly factor BamB